MDRGTVVLRRSGVELKVNWPHRTEIRVLETSAFESLYGANLPLVINSVDKPNIDFGNFRKEDRPMYVRRKHNFRSIQDHSKTKIKKI